MSNTAVDEILSHFPGPVTMPGSRTRLFLGLVTNPLFVCLGIWAVSNGYGFAWLFVFVFGLRAILCAASLCRPANLTLDSEGLQITTVVSRNRFRWRDVAGFKKSKFPMFLPFSKNVYFKFLPLVRLYATNRIAKIFVAITGGNFGLRNTFDLSGDELVRLLEHWRNRAVAE